MKDAWELLAARDFRLLLLGRTVSQLGNQISVVAMTFGVLALTGSATDVGLVLAAESVALAACLLFGGVLADRMSRRRLMIVADLIRLVSQGSVAVMLITGTASVWSIVVPQMVSGAASGLFVPAVSAMQPEVAPAGRIREANALRGLVIAVATVIGPVIAGLLVATVNAGWVLALDALSFLVSAVLVGRIRAGAAPVTQSANMLRSMADGWQEFRSRRWLWTVAAQNAAVRMLALAPFMVLGPVQALEGLGGSQAWGLILGALGAGAMVGGFLAFRLRPRRPLLLAVAGVTAFAPMIVLLALGAPVWLIAAGAFLAGIEQSVFWTLWQTALHDNIPPAVLSRVSSYDWLGAYAFEPIGYALAGPVAVLLGTRNVLLAAGAVVIAATLFALTAAQVRNLPAAVKEEVTAT